MPKYNLHVMLTVYLIRHIMRELMQIRQTNQGFNFDNYPTFDKNIDPKQRAWIEVRGKAVRKM